MRQGQHHPQDGRDGEQRLERGPQHLGQHHIVERDGRIMMPSQVFCPCMRENAEYSASKLAAFIALMQIEPAGQEQDATGTLASAPAPPTLTCPTRRRRCRSQRPPATSVARQCCPPGWGWPACATPAGCAKTPATSGPTTQAGAGLKPVRGGGGARRWAWYVMGLLRRAARTVDALLRERSRFSRACAAGKILADPVQHAP